MARAAAPMLRGLRAATRTTRKRSNSAQTDKYCDFTTRRGKAFLRMAIEQIAFSFLWSMTVNAFHEKAGRSQVGSSWFLLVSCFSQPSRQSRHGRHPFHPHSCERSSLGTSWVFSFQPVL